MKAVIRRGTSLICDEVSAPIPTAGQTLVKTLCCGICGSDLHALHYLDNMVEAGIRSGGESSLNPKADVIFGHEFCAEVLEHGPGTTGALKAGTRVVSMPVLITATGFNAVGYSNTTPGGFAEQMVLNENMLIPVPNGLSTDHAAMTEPFAVGAHAAAAAALEPGSPCLVLGCGPVGLAVIAALKSRGHGPVIAADFSPTRRATAEKMGADVIIDPAKAHALVAALLQVPGDLPMKLAGRALDIEALHMRIGLSSPTTVASFSAAPVIQVTIEHPHSVSARAVVPVDCAGARVRAVEARRLTEASAADVKTLRYAAQTEAKRRRFLLSHVWLDNADAVLQCAPDDTRAAADRQAADRTMNASIVPSGGSME